MLLTDILFDSNFNARVQEIAGDFRKKAGALSVLTYFFETCDIFEK